MTEDNEDVEDVDSFTHRARAWLAANYPPLEHGADPFDRLSGQEAIAHARRLQRLLFDGGFAGIVFPREYGGLGLTPAHQRAFTRESRDYQSPLRFNMSTVAIIAPTLLQYGSADQKLRYVPAILTGEEMWVQMLSEPSGGSDLAGALTRADRDGDHFVLNGSKTWTSGAHLRDWGLCLARTDWDVPKHRGLSMFIVELDEPGVTVRQIRQVNGDAEFCEEFFDDVLLAPDRLVGPLHDGWTVASAMLVHERNAVGGGTPYAGRITGRSVAAASPRRQGDLIEMVRARGIAGDPLVRARIADAHIEATVRKHLIGRITAGMQRGSMPPAATTALKLFTARTSAQIATTALELAGPAGVVFASRPGAANRANAYLMRQRMSIGGGTSEMQRNSISERWLGMPKERTPDKDVAFSDVRTSTLARPPA